MPGALSPAGYLPRVADREMESALQAAPAVVVEGPRACGKTWTARRFAGRFSTTISVHALDRPMIRAGMGRLFASLGCNESTDAI